MNNWTDLTFKKLDNDTANPASVKIYKNFLHPDATTWVPKNLRTHLVKPLSDEFTFREDRRRKAQVTRVVQDAEMQSNCTHYLKRNGRTAFGFKKGVKI